MYASVITFFKLLAFALETTPPLLLLASWCPFSTFLVMESLLSFVISSNCSLLLQLFSSSQKLLLPVFGIVSSKAIFVFCWWRCSCNCVVAGDGGMYLVMIKLRIQNLNSEIEIFLTIDCLHFCSVDRNIEKLTSHQLH